MESDIKETIKQTEEYIKELDKWMLECKEATKRFGDIIDKVLKDKDVSKYLFKLEDWKIIQIYQFVIVILPVISNLQIRS